MNKLDQTKRTRDVIAKIRAAENALKCSGARLSAPEIQRELKRLKASMPP